MRYRLFALVLLAAMSVAHGEDREIYQQDSFIDPSYLGVKMAVNGSEPATGGTGFETFGAAIGTIGQYQDREVFTDTERQFVDMLYDRYWSDYQFGAELTEFERREGGTNQRGTIEFGRYSLNRTPSDPHEDPFVSRWMTYLTVDDRLGLGTQYEAGANLMVELPFKFLSSTRRNQCELSRRQRCQCDTGHVAVERGPGHLCARARRLERIVYVRYRARPKRRGLSASGGSIAPLLPRVRACRDTLGVCSGVQLQHAQRRASI